MILFTLKKLISRLLFPVPLVLLIAALGLVLLWRRKDSVLGRAIVSAAFLVLLLFGTPPIADALLRPLESVYPPLDVTTLSESGVGYIVVLAGGDVYPETMPLTAHFSAQDMARMVEGIRLARALPDATLIFSGGLGVPKDVSDAERDNYQFAVMLGIDPARILVDANSLDTAQQATNIAAMVGDGSLILVTSASHMPRAMGLFETSGLAPIAAPTDFRLHPGGETIRLAWSWIPNVGALDKSERAIYEYLGLAWAKLTGLID